MHSYEIPVALVNEGSFRKDVRVHTSYYSCGFPFVINPHKGCWALTSQMLSREHYGDDNLKNWLKVREGGICLKVSIRNRGRGKRSSSFHNTVSQQPTQAMLEPVSTNSKIAFLFMDRILFLTKTIDSQPHCVATASTSKEDATLDSSFSSLFRNLKQSSDPGESKPTV